MIAGFELVQYFEQHPDKAITILQLSKHIGKSYGGTHAAVTELTKQGVLKTERVGAAIACLPNLKSEKAIALLASASLLRAAETETSGMKEAIRHLRDSSYVIWCSEGTLYAIMRPHATTSVSGGMAVKSVTIDELYPDTMAKGIVLWGADVFWHLASEKP